ncbi:MAG: hypothetical protein EU549_04280, partial [Promethearchaeota archaeon]
MKFKESLLLIIVVISIISPIIPKSILHNVYRADKIVFSQTTDMPNWGIIEIYDVILEKTEMEVGESIIINATYDLIMEEGWIYNIFFGITNNEMPQLFKELPIIDGLHINVSHKFYFEPDLIDISTNYRGFLGIEVFEINSSSHSRTTLMNFSSCYLSFNRADLKLDIINLSPEILFTHDSLNLSFEVYNEHNYTFKYKNRPVLIDSEKSGELKINETVFTNNQGFVNSMLNICNLGVGFSNIKIKIEICDIYEYHITSIDDILIYNESSSFTFTVKNNDSIYSNIGLNDSYSTIEIEAYTEFEARVFLNSTFNSILLDNLTTKHHECIIKSPKKSGNYIITGIASPNSLGKNLTIMENLNIKKRPIEIITNINRSKNAQFNLDFFISLKDILTT